MDKNSNADTTVRATKELVGKLKILRGYYLTEGVNKFYHELIEELVDNKIDEMKNKINV